MKLYRFERGLEGAVTCEAEGMNLPGGFLWEPAGMVASPTEEFAAPWEDIIEIVRDVGFFIWPLPRRPPSRPAAGE